ncbi:protein FAM189B-like, partial [Manacus vitellinus]|uniref:protein FAM189B-like n=1 Tax=Manacus vitellinus TaxID=328815 RepID=UPI00115F1EC0
SPPTHDHSGFAGVLHAGLLSSVIFALVASLLKRPFTLVIAFFTLLSVLGVMLSLAGSILSCQNAQLVKSLEACERERDSCVCCQARSEPPPASCSQQSEMLTMFPNPNCRSIRVALKDLLFSVCGLTVFSTVICTLSAVVCCIRIFSLDIVHV